LFASVSPCPQPTRAMSRLYEENVKYALNHGLITWSTDCAPLSVCPQISRIFTDYKISYPQITLIFADYKTSYPQITLIFADYKTSYPQITLIFADYKTSYPQITLIFAD
jgi:hypothetical protein